MNLGVLASGSGTNLQAILDACAGGDLAGLARVAVVLCDRPCARALERARGAGVPAEVVDWKAFARREDFCDALRERLAANAVELVCLAGFMRVVTPAFLRAFPRRVINIHPALAPAFPGTHAQRKAFEHGVKITGCTVHFVDEGVDTGPILAQAAVPVLDGDDAESLRLRILAEEHRIYPLAIRLIAEGRVELSGRRVVVRGAAETAGALRNPW